MAIESVRYRMKTTKSGKKVRPALKEAKNVKSGAMHTQTEFAVDRAHRGRAGGVRRARSS